MGDQNLKEARTWGMLCHLSTFAGCLVPFGNFLGPFVCWLLKKNEYPYVDYHAKEALNFQISVLIYLVVSALLIFVLIGIVLFPAVLIFDIVCTILATIQANDGKFYRYPLSIPFFRAEAPPGQA